MNNNNIRRRLLKWIVIILAGIQIYSLFLIQALAGLAILFGIWHGLKLIRRSEIPNVRRIGIAFLLLMLFRMFSVIYSSDRGTGFNDLQFPALAMVFFVMSDWHSFMDRKHMKLFETVWFWAAVVASIICVGKYIMGMEARIGPPLNSPMIRSDGVVFGQYATLAKYLTLTILYFGVCLLYSDKIYNIKLRLTGLLILAAGLLLTFSRACWLAVAIVLAWFTIRVKSGLFALLIVGGIVIVMAVPYGRTRVIESFSVTDWSSGRVELWSIAFTKAGEHPIIGNGIGSFDAIITSDIRTGLPDSGVGDWHNQAIQLFMENGIIGLALFFWLIVELFVGCIQMRKRTDDIDFPRVASGGIALLTGFIIFSMFDTILDSPMINISFFLLVGMLVGWMRYKPGKTVQ